MSFRKEKYLAYRESDVITKVNYLDDLSGDEIHNLFLEGGPLRSSGSPR